MKLFSRPSIVCLIFFLLFGAFNTNAYAATLNLVAGWNLLGNSTSAAIDVATFSDTSKITTVWKWNKAASKWAFYTPSMNATALASYAQTKGYDVLGSIAPKEGFWVNASSAAVLAGSVASGVTLAQSDLQVGWNLMGSADNKTPSQLNANLNSSLNAAGKAIVTAWAWDASSTRWKFYAPSMEAQGGLANYIASKGYQPFNAALQATDGFWLNIGAVTPTTPTSTISTLMNDFANLFSAGLPTQAAVAAKLASGFLMDGMDASTYAKQLTTAPSPLAPGDYFVTVSSTRFDNAGQGNAVAETQWVNATQLNAAGAIVGESRIKLVNVGGIWLIAGNERTVQVNLKAESGMTSAIAATAAASAVPATFSSDVSITVDPTTAALSGVASAWVSGASIVAQSASGVNIYSNPTPATFDSAVQHSQIPLCDLIVVTDCTNAVDGSEYTITLKDAAGAVLATYKETLKKAPLSASALNAAMFPSIGTITPSTIAGVTPGAPMSVSWLNPAGLVSNWVDFTVWDSNGVLVFQQSGSPSGNTFSGNFPVFIPPAADSGIALSRFEITVQAADAYGRQYVTFR